MHAEFCRGHRKPPELGFGPQVSVTMGTSRVTSVVGKDSAKQGQPEAKGRKQATRVRRSRGTMPYRKGEHPHLLPFCRRIVMLKTSPTSEPAHSRISDAYVAARGKKFPAGITAHTEAANEQRTFVLYSATRGKGAMAWTACPGGRRALGDGVENLVRFRGDFDILQEEVP